MFRVQHWPRARHQARVDPMCGLQDTWLLVIGNVCACFILGLLALGATGPLFRLHPSGCDTTLYENVTEDWHIGNDWVMLPLNGLCPVGAVEIVSSNGYRRYSYTNCMKWQDEAVWRSLDDNNKNSSYPWNPSSSVNSSSIPLPPNTFVQGAMNWVHIHGILVTATIFIIFAAICSSQLTNHIKGTRRFPTERLDYSAEIVTGVLMVVSVALLFTAYMLSVHTLQLDELAWEKSFFASCRVEIFTLPGYESAFWAGVMCLVYLALIFGVLLEAGIQGREHAPVVCCDRIQARRENGARERAQRASYGITSSNVELYDIESNSRNLNNPFREDNLPVAQSEVVVTYDTSGSAHTVPRSSVLTTRVLRGSGSCSNSGGGGVVEDGNRGGFEVVAISDIDIGAGTDDERVGNQRPVQGQFICFHDDDEDEGIVTRISGTIVGSDEEETQRREEQEEETYAAENSDLAEVVAVPVRINYG